MIGPARFVLVAAALAATACASGCQPSTANPPSKTAEIVRVVDGDTLIVDDGGEEVDRVRLLGIDTPESVKPGTPPECGSKRASASLAELAPRGSRVRLTTDGDSGDVRDDYGRLLAFVAVGGRDLGLVQIRRGWADVYAYRDRRFAGRARYERARDRAAGRRVGVHRLCGG
jgi:micrococcal nuclease